MRPYIIAAVFNNGDNDGQLTTNALVANDPEMAAALHTQICASSGVKGTIMSIAVVELQREFLVEALRTWRQQEAPAVVSLVKPEEAS